MADFKEAVMSNLSSFYNDICDDKFNKDNFLKEYIDSYQDFLRDVSSYLNTYSDVSNDITNSNLVINESFKKQKEKFDSNLKKDIAYITNQSLLKVLNQQNDIKAEISNNESVIKKNQDEKLLITSSTNPVISSHFRKRNAEIELYTLNIKKINTKYNELVNKITDKRDQDSLQITKDNNIYMNSYEAASNNVIRSFENQIKEYKENIDSIEEEINNLKNKYSNDCLELEKSFNKSIMKIQSETKEKIEILAKNYNINKDFLNNKREDQRNKNQDERSIVFKDFVQQIHILNDKIDEFDTNQKNHLYDQTLIFNLKIFDLEQQIRRIKEENYKLDSKIDKHKIKENSKQIPHLLKLMKIENIALKAKTDVIKRFYKLRPLDYSNRKLIYEDIKNHQIEKLNYVTDIEDNAHHNKLAILQLEYDYEVDNLNRVTESHIHELRYKFDLELIKISEEFKINLTKLYVKKQAFINDVNLAENEMELAKKLNVVVNDNASKTLDNNLSRVSTLALLEIEKNDILRNYNVQKLENQIAIEKALYDYNEKNEFLHRDKKNSLVDLNTIHSNFTLEHNKIISALNIELETLTEDYQKQLKTQKHAELSTTATANHIYSLFINRKKMLINLFNATKNILTLFIRGINSFVKKEIFANKISDKEFLKNTISSIITKANQVCNNIIDVARENVLRILNDQIAFETGAKYQTRFNSLKTEYDTKINLLEAQSIDLNATLENYNETNRMFYQNLGNVQTKISSFSHQLKRNEINRAMYRKETIGLKNEVKRIQTLINKNELKIEKISKKVALVPTRIQLLKDEYENRRTKIVNEQKDEFSILFDGIKDFESFFNQTNKMLNETSNLLHADTYYKFIVQINKISTYYITHSQKIIDLYLKIVSNIESDITKRYDKLIRKNQQSYNNQTSIVKKAYQRNALNVNLRIDNENNKYADILKNHNNRVLETSMDFDYQIKENEDNFKETKDNIYQKERKEHDEYNTKSSSTRDNILGNINLHSKYNKELDLMNSKDNITLVSKYIGFKDKIVERNNNRLDSFNLSIKNIPYESKLETQDYSQKEFLYQQEFNINQKNYLLKLNETRNGIESETRKYASNLQNKIGNINTIISKERKAIAQKS
jgi:hypothetical protein